MNKHDQSRHTVDSYVKNLIADSGNILATDRPLPVQKAKTPPSAYIRATAFPIALAPNKLGFAVNNVPPRSGGRVIRNIFSRSKGAVHVRDTAENVSLCE